MVLRGHLPVRLVVLDDFASDLHNYSECNSYSEVFIFFSVH